MRRKLTSAAILAVVFVALALGWSFRRQAPQQPYTQEMTTAASESEPFQFLLKTKKQNLELFHLRDGGWKKLVDFPLALDDLPEADLKLLRTGLVLRDAGELQRSLEDYLPNS